MTPTASPPIYCQAEFPVVRKKTGYLNIAVRPAGSDDSRHVRFRHQIFGP